MSTDLGPFRAVDHPFSIAVEGESDVDIGELFDGLRAPSERPAVRYRFVLGDDGEEAVGDLFEDDELIGNGRTRVLLQLLISRLGQAALSPDTVAVHGTTVADDRGAVMLVGPSGRGKSTLAAVLLDAGMDLIAEDISAIDPSTGFLRTYHRPLGLSEASFQLLDREIPAAAGAPCGCGGKVMVSDRHLGFSYSSSVETPLLAVVLVDHAQDDLVEHTPARMLSLLLELGVVVTTDRPGGLEALAALLARARCVELGSAQLAVAADWIAQLLDRPRSDDDVVWLVERRGDTADVFIGTEAVLVGDGMVQHLNSTAAAIHLLSTEGRRPEQIAEDLDLGLDEIEEALRSIR